MIVGFSFDIGVCKEEDGEYNGNDVPARENQSGVMSSVATQHNCLTLNVNMLALVTSLLDVG